MTSRRQFLKILPYSFLLTACKTFEFSNNKLVIYKLEANKSTFNFNEKFKTNKQKKRIIVTDLGRLVLEYLNKNLKTLLDTNFTALVEADLDKISNGEIEWLSVIRKLYDSFNPIILSQMGFKNMKDQKKSDDKIICQYKGENITLKKGRYGPYLQYKTKNYNVKGYLQYKKKEKEELDLDDCKIIMKYPLKICKYKQNDVCVNIGPYGYYLRYNNNLYHN